MRTVLIALLLTVPSSLAEEALVLSCRPSKEVTASEIVTVYSSLVDLSLQTQRQQMWALDSETRAAVWVYNIEKYSREHPDLSERARSVLGEAMRLISTPAWFDIQDGSVGYPAKLAALAELKRGVEAVFSADAVVEIFIRLGPEPSSVVRDTSAQGSRLVIQPDADFECHCGSNFDCGSSASYGCFTSWCIKKVHCGYYADEPCWGKCKSTGL
jgi:hypothetical protein